MQDPFLCQIWWKTARKNILHCSVAADFPPDLLPSFGHYRQPLTNGRPVSARSRRQGPEKSFKQ